MTHGIPPIPDDKSGQNMRLAVYAASVVFNLVAIFVKVIAPEWGTAFLDAAQLLASIAGGTAIVSNVQQRSNPYK